ncbi:MAG TPA: sigma-54-dependent Fis family transcriptional regulator, partial [candidate division Zixibacteria bacterium]|nr:sigma-54-dependent Fis family transcriptional regulator [candidate division Zixibacteria bacterium]
LQEREYEPLGSTTAIKADIRIVAATNQDLKEQISQGKFRDDLYFRLAVVKFDLPPLSRRREDIPYLVDHFISNFNAKKGKNVIGVSPKVMEILMKHEYNGNVRELENIIEYCFAVTRERIIQPSNLPSEVLEAAGELSQQEQAGKVSSSASKADSEEALIRDTLRECQGSRKKAAEILGIDRTTLWRKMKKYGIEIP